MILDIIFIVLFVFMMIYGYSKGFIRVVAKLVSLILALILSYFLADTVGSYVANTSIGTTIKVGIENSILDKINTQEEMWILSTIQEKLNLVNEIELVQKIINYVFIGIGFIGVFLTTRIALWIAQNILEKVFELPVLKSFNKLSGVIASIILFVIEISVILAIIKCVSTISFMSGVINIINSSVIIKAIYEHNIFTSLILSKII